MVVEGDGNAAYHSLRVRQLGLAVARKVDRDLVAQRGKRAGQGTDYIGQTAGLGEGTPSEAAKAICMRRRSS